MEDALIVEKTVYEIRVARLDEVDALQAFLHEHWREGHIFTKSKTLLDWQHLDAKSEQYNFIVGVEKASGDFHGVLGYIPLSQFDPEMKANDFNWMAIWKVADAARGHRLGRAFMTFLQEEISPTILSTVGASGMSLRMYEEQGYQVGRMHQHYILNPQTSAFTLVDLAGKSIPEMASAAIGSGKCLKNISEADFLTGDKPYFKGHVADPKKTPNYIANRYFRHPLYRYDVFEIIEDNVATGLIVIRECKSGTRNALRMVDFIGPESALTGLGTCFLEVLSQTGAEHLDFYSAVIAMHIL